MSLGLTLKEKNVIPLRDGAELYLVYNKTTQLQRRGVVVLLHGLTGNPHEAVHEIGRRALNEAGYDVLRPAFYWYGEKMRQLHQTTLATHVEDVQAVLDWIVQQFGAKERVFLVGHSYGATTLLKGQFGGQVRAQVLWDVYPDMAGYWREEAENDGHGGWFLDKRILMKAGEAMVKEGMGVTIDAVCAWARQAKVPTLMVVAEDGGAGKMECDRLFATLPEAKEKVVIEGAGHTFVEGDAAERLMLATLAFLNRFSEERVG